MKFSTSSKDEKKRGLAPIAPKKPVDKWKGEELTSKRAKTDLNSTRIIAVQTKLQKFCRLYPYVELSHQTRSKLESLFGSLEEVIDSVNIEQQDERPRLSAAIGVSFERKSRSQVVKTPKVKPVSSFSSDGLGNLKKEKYSASDSVREKGFQKVSPSLLFSPYASSREEYKRSRAIKGGKDKFGTETSKKAKRRGDSQPLGTAEAYNEYKSSQAVKNWKKNFDTETSEEAKRRGDRQLLRTATEEEIYKVLTHLHRKPKDLSELKKEILGMRKAGAIRALEEAEKQHNYVPY